MKNAWNKLCVKWVLISELAGVLSGVLSMKGMQIYANSFYKPSLTPPGWVFPVVWTILYALMGIGICLVSKGESPQKQCKCVNIFVAQLIVNFFWPLLFFNTFAFFVALLWIVILFILVSIMTMCFLKVNKAVAWLQVPYLIWLSFAAYLNAAVWLLNS